MWYESGMVALSLFAGFLGPTWSNSLPDVVDGVELGDPPREVARNQTWIKFTDKKVLWNGCGGGRCGQEIVDAIDAKGLDYCFNEARRVEVLFYFRSGRLVELTAITPHRCPIVELRRQIRPAAIEKFGAPKVERSPGRGHWFYAWELPKTMLRSSFAVGITVRQHELVYTMNATGARPNADEFLLAGTGCSVGDLTPCLTGWSKIFRKRLPSVEVSPALPGHVRMCRSIPEGTFTCASETTRFRFGGFHFLTVVQAVVRGGVVRVEKDYRVWDTMNRKILNYGSPYRYENASVSSTTEPITFKDDFSLASGVAGTYTLDVKVRDLNSGAVSVYRTAFEIAK